MKERWTLENMEERRAIIRTLMEIDLTKTPISEIADLMVNEMIIARKKWNTEVARSREYQLTHGKTKGDQLLRKIRELSPEDQAFMDGYLFAKVTERQRKGA